MHVVFVDDTKQKPGPRRSVGSLTALGAVAFPSGQLKAYAESFWKIYDDLGIPYSAEMKWSLDSKTSWFLKQDDKTLIGQVRKRALKAARHCEAKAIVVAWDTDAVATFRGQPAEQVVLSWLYERLQMMLDNAGEEGVVVFDKPGGDHRAEDRWLTESKSLVDAGSEYIQPEAFVLPILTAPSHHHPHLQLADLVAGSLTAAVQGKPFGTAMVEKIKPILHTNYQGLVGGTGLKLWPDSMNNLHHWVLGEEEYYVSRRLRTLPHPGFSRFQDDNGLSVK